MDDARVRIRGFAQLTSLAAAVLLTGCTDLFFGGETIRVSGTVTTGGVPAVGWVVKLMPSGTPNTTYDASETDATGRYRELVVFGQPDCSDIRVATRPPDVPRGTWTEKELTCGDNRVDFSF